MKKTGVLLAFILIVILSSIGCTASPSVGKALTEDPSPAEPTPTIPLPSSTLTPFQPLLSPTLTPAQEPTPTAVTISGQDLHSEDAGIIEVDEEIAAVDQDSENIDPTVEQPPSPRIRQDIPRAEVTIRLELAAEGLNIPVGLASPPDRTGRLFIVDQTGAVYLLLPDGELRQEPLLNLTDRIISADHINESGSLHALAFHPEFAQNGQFFVFYTTPTTIEGLDQQTFTGRLSAFSMSHWSRFQADPASEQILLEVSLPYSFNNGIQIGTNASGLLLFSNPNGAHEGGSRNMCFDLALDGYAEVECSGESLNQIPTLDLWLTNNGADHQNNPGSLTAVVEGLFYQGLTFPSYEGHYFFAAQPETEGNSYSRLYVASPHTLGDRGWMVEELVIANQATSRLAETVTGFGLDSAGRLYLLTSGNPGLDGDRGRLYKVLPYVRSHNSTISRPEDYLPLTHRYAQVPSTAPIYATLDDVRAGEPTGTHGGGSFWVSERNQTQVNGRTYYWVSWAWGRFTWISASHIRFNAPLSHLRGIDLQQRPAELLAITTSPLHVRSIPALITDETIVASLRKYDMVYILERRVVNAVSWYRIGPDQWVHGDYIRLLTPSSRPEGVEPGEKWIEVNLDQQTVIAHEGDTPVFATLTSTGRRGFATTKGLYQVWSMFREAPMQWLDARPPYSLANVPYIMYFNKDQGLHGAYWHDLYGSVRSAGCVNLSPHDAHWLFHWAGPELRPDQRMLYTSKEEPGVWVWVHDSVPDLDVLLTGLMMDKLQWPEENILLP
jgi:hypothetical protein